MADEVKATQADHLRALRKEVEVRFTGAFADNLVNALDAAASRQSATSDALAAMREAREALEAAIAKIQGGSGK